MTPNWVVTTPHKGEGLFKVDLRRDLACQPGGEEEKIKLFFGLKLFFDFSKIPKNVIRKMSHGLRNTVEWFTEC